MKLQNFLQEIDIRFNLAIINKVEFSKHYKLNKKQIKVKSHSIILMSNTKNTKDKY